VAKSTVSRRVREMIFKSFGKIILSILIIAQRVSVDTLKKINRGPKGSAKTKADRVRKSNTRSMGSFSKM
jgi:hypothetical protein